MGLKFTYTVAVFDGVNFSLKTFGVDFLFCSFLLPEDLELSQDCGSHFSDMLFRSVHKFPGAGLCDDHCNTFALLSLSHFVRTRGALRIDVLLPDPPVAKFSLSGGYLDMLHSIS